MGYLVYVTLIQVHRGHLRRAAKIMRGGTTNERAHRDSTAVLFSSLLHETGLKQILNTPFMLRRLCV